jgi:hypothetical protein
MGRDDCAERWQAERDRLIAYRRQRAVVHCDQTRSLEEIVRDAEYLDRSIAAEVKLLARIEDEHNAHTAGTWEHAQRALVSA